jgi:hypothetical protein
MDRLQNELDHGLTDNAEGAALAGRALIWHNSGTVNRGWVLVANLACDLNSWTRLLGLHDQPDLAHAEPDTLRYRLWHLPARLSRHARRRWLAISSTWPCRDAFTTCWQRLCQLPAPT